MEKSRANALSGPASSDLDRSERVMSNPEMEPLEQPPSLTPDAQMLVVDEEAPREPYK